MERVSEFPGRVTLYDDGAYRWTYDLRAHGNRAMLNTMVGICAAVFVPIAVIVAALTWRYGPLQAVLYALLLLAVGVGLPTLMWIAAPPDPSFRMTEEGIEAWPRGKNRNAHSYEDVRRVILRPDIHCVRLRWAVAGLDVYVPPEDYDFVKDFLLACVPDGAQVE